MSVITRILLPTDCTERSQRAMAYAVRLARDWAAEIIVFAVYDVSRLWHMGMALYGSEDALNVRDAETCARELAMFVSPFQAGSDAPRIATLQASGIPHEEILRAARDENVDLIIMATSHRRGVRHMILGSVSERVYRGAPCPVLIIPPEHENAA